MLSPDNVPRLFTHAWERVKRAVEWVLDVVWYAGWPGG